MIAQNIRAKAMTNIENSIREKSMKLGVKKHFLARTEKALTEKENNNQLDFFNITNFCVSKNTIKKIEKQASK